jgi:hypothetical protein
LGFLAFNIITYSLLIAELVITNTQIHSEEDKVRKQFSNLSLKLIESPRKLETLLRHGLCFENSYKTGWNHSTGFCEKGHWINTKKPLFLNLLQRFFTNVFNGCYAILMFIVVIFFLIYGVEVYFKVRICLFTLFNVIVRDFVYVARSPKFVAVLESLNFLSTGPWRFFARGRKQHSVGDYFVQNHFLVVFTCVCVLVCFRFFPGSR